jgi:hypothetical protein
MQATEIRIKVRKLANVELLKISPERRAMNMFGKYSATMMCRSEKS